MDPAVSHLTVLSVLTGGVKEEDGSDWMFWPISQTHNSELSQTVLCTDAALVLHAGHLNVTQ